MPLTASQPPGAMRRTRSRCKLDDRATADVRDDDVERTLDLGQGTGPRVELTLQAVARCVPPCRLDRLGLDVDGDDPTGTEPKRAQSQHSTAATHVEHTLTPADPLDELVHDHAGRRMGAVAEAPEPELDPEGLGTPRML